MTGGGGSGSGTKCCRVDAGPRDQIHASLRHAEAEHESLVVRVLHDSAASLPLEQGFQRGNDERAGELALAMIADEERAEPGEAVDHGDGRKPDAGDAAEQHRLQRDVVQDVRPDLAQELAQLRHAGKAVRRRQAAALPGQRMRDEALGLDRLLALVQPRRDMNFVAGRLRRARHGQAVRQEVPVLGNDIEDAGGSHGIVLPAEPKRARHGAAR